jgi:hypothetical protein
MKKGTCLFFLLGAVLMMSCQKKQDWDCTCTIKNAGDPSFTVNEVILNETQSAANDQCNEYGQSYFSGNGSYSCKID